ncbi:MAG TPA: hypothetical protein ENL04_02635 [Sulfuricurvum sp.]|nr:hypothetical protein [Sulfuricurvum sp.]
MHILFFLLFAICLGAVPLLQRSQVMMGTIVTLSVMPERANVLQKAFNRIKQVEDALSSYAPRADIYRLNHDRNVSIGPDTYEALQLSRRYYRESSGYFNIAVGAITHERFHFGEQTRLPSTQELDDAHLNLDGLSFDRYRASLFGKINLDLGGMGKGFAADKANDVFRDNNVTRGRIALSGDIRCIDRCEIAITNPFEHDTPPSPRKCGGRSIIVMRFPEDMISARSMIFSSSRTFPGQAYSIKSRMALASMASGAAFCICKKCATRSGISSFLFRSGGRKIGNTLMR